MLLYLAGPDVFVPNARAIGARKAALCREHGLDAVFPGDGGPELAGLDGGDAALRIFAHCCAGMRRADAIIANMSPFRGPSMDTGTAFEMGFMDALGKPVFGYTSDPRAYGDRVPAAGRHTDGQPLDADGMLVEDFGLGDNLMMVGAVARMALPVAAVPATRDDPIARLVAMEAFAACLAQIAAHVREGTAR